MTEALRICSLLPSATEIVFALGLGGRLVGVTHECDHPPEAARLPAVTASTLGHARRDSREIHHHIAAALHAGSSIYTLDQALLERLDPDLILTQELCDVCAVSYREVERAVHRLEGRRTVLSLEPTTLGTILESVRQVGWAAGVAERASALTDDLRERLDAVATATADIAVAPRLLALEWLDPPMAAGHWVPEMVRLAGGQDVLGHESHPSARVEWASIAAAAPEVVVLMPCGFALERTIEEHARTACAAGVVRAACGARGTGLCRRRLGLLQPPGTPHRHGGAHPGRDPPSRSISPDHPARRLAQAWVVVEVRT